MRDAQLKGAKLTNAYYDNHTKWPSPLVPLLSGATFFDLLARPPEEMGTYSFQQAVFVVKGDSRPETGVNLCKLESGAVVPLLAVHIDWVKVVTADDFTGFVNCPEFVEQLSAWDEGKSLDVHLEHYAWLVDGDERPDASKVLRLLSPGSTLRVSAMHGDWVKVQADDGRVGFVAVDATVAIEDEA